MVTPTRNPSFRERFNISRLAIAHPWLTAGFWIAVTVAGLLAFSSLKYALFPDITFPVVVVNAKAPLDTALDTEVKLTQPIEQQLQSLTGVDDIRSSTYPGQNVISLSFQVGTNLEESSRQVETALSQLTLPQETTFRVIPLNLNESAAASYAITSASKNLTELTQLAREEIVPSLEKLPGVLKVSLLGASEAEEQRGKSPTPPLSRSPALPLSSSPALPLSSSPALPLSSSPAQNANGVERRTSAVRFNGKDALAFQVIKQAKANTLDVVTQVENEVQKLQSTLSDVQLTLAATQAGYIREATQSTIDALILAVILAVVVIFPFLWNGRATLISALAIPLSLVGTFIVMAGFRLNLETITLLALALVIGIIVDDAIVDIENIIRHLENGESPRQAAIAATNEIGLTVTAATFTIVAVFLPVAFMGGVLGQFFKPFGLTVSAAITISWLAARTLVPVLAVVWLRLTPIGIRRRQSWGKVIQFYRNLLHWSLIHRWLVMGIALLSLVFGLALIPFIPKGFIPKLDRGEFNIVYTTPLAPSIDLSTGQGLSWNNLVSALETLRSPLTKPLEVARKLEAVVLRSPEVKTVFTTIGTSPGQPNKGNLYIKLKKEHTLSTAEIQDQLRQQLPAISDVAISVEDIKFVEIGNDKPFQVALIGNNLSNLSTTAKALKERIQTLPGFVDVTATGESDTTGTILQIEHLNTRRVAYVSANLDKTMSLGKAADLVLAEANGILPSDITLKLRGDSGLANIIFGSFGQTLALAVICILVLLMVLFKSWVDPLIVLFSLPLAIVGAMLALLFTPSGFSMISFIGIIFLLGLVNKNAILIVDSINQLRSSQLNRTEAILQAVPLRLRPILMTSSGTILGMMPIALGIGAGSELRSPMAVTIIGGMITSTLLSLLVVPVVYALLDDWQPHFRKRVR